tara:strand:+ start:595 stop:1503 length:909 start_codon:yes stop_codon:yes gene_type:complete
MNTNNAQNAPLSGFSSLSRYKLPEHKEKTTNISKLHSGSLTDLYHGDCLEIMDELIENGTKVEAIITDPPYGLTSCEWDSVIPFEEMWPRLNELIIPGGAILLFGIEPFSSTLRVSNLKEYNYDWYLKKTLVSNFMNAHSQPMRRVEMVHVFNAAPERYFPQGLTRILGSRAKKNNSKCEVYNMDSVLRRPNYTQEFTNYPNNLLDCGRPQEPYHPTQKPVDLMEYLVETYTKQGEKVLDFTMGSGSTGVACKQLKRHFLGIELDDEYFTYAKNRIESTPPGTSLKTKQLNLSEYGRPHKFY